MLFNETLKISDNFSVDENNGLFRYKHGKEFIISLAANIESCFVMADLDSIDKSYFNEQDIEGIGKVHFVKDEGDFSKAVMQADLVLSICYYDKNQEIRCFRKNYDSKSDQVFAISAKVNRLISKSRK